MTFCQSVERDDGTWECPECGYTWPGKFFKRCGQLSKPTVETVETIFPDGWDEELQELGATDQDEHTLRGLYIKWREAIKKWKEAGKPTRSKQQIAEIVAICQACDHYNTRAGMGHCGKCGCHVNTLSYARLNKAAMATESCPLKPPKW